MRFNLLILVLCFYLISCNNETNNTSNTENNVTSNTENNVIDDFKITPIYGTFINYKGISYLKSTFEIINQTNSKLTTYQISGFLEIQFQNKKITFVPKTIFNENMSESTYLEENRPIKIYARDLNRNNPVWLPNKQIKLTFNLIETPLEIEIIQIAPNALLTNEFERTPTSASLVITCKGISINGDYNSIFRFSILDLWKHNQEKLGLR